MSRIPPPKIFTRSNNVVTTSTNATGTTRRNHDTRFRLRPLSHYLEASVELRDGISSTGRASTSAEDLDLIHADAKNEMTTRRISIVDLTNDSNESTETLTISNKSLADEIEAGFSRLSCPICFEIMPQNKVSATKCGHIFCTDCITSSLIIRTNCPICNDHTTSTDLIRLYF